MEELIKAREARAAEKEEKELMKQLKEQLRQEQFNKNLERVHSQDEQALAQIPKRLKQKHGHFFKQLTKVLDITREQMQHHTGAPSGAPLSSE